MSTLERGLLWLPRQVGRWTSEHPLRAAGGGAALVALLVMALSVDLAGSGATNAAAVATALTEVAVARPAYPAAAVVGCGVLLFG